MTIGILKKQLKGMSIDSLNAVSGGHFSQHFSCDNLSQSGKRQGGFFNKKLAEKCFYETFADELNLETLVMTINRDYYGHDEIYGEFDEVIGQVYLPVRKRIVESMDVRVAIDFHGKYYTNPKTGLPFDIISFFPVNENEDN